MPYDQFMSLYRVTRSTSAHQRFHPSDESRSLSGCSDQERVSLDVIDMRDQSKFCSSDRRFANLFELSIDAILILDAHGQCIEANTAAYELLGASQATCVGQPFTQFLELPEAAEWQTLQRQPQGEWHLRRLDGTQRQVEYRLNSEFTDECSLVLLRDLTERHQLQRQIQQQQKYQTLFEILPIGVCITSADGAILEANPASEEILGISIAEQTRRTYDSPDWHILRIDGTPMPVSEYASVRALQENRVIVGEEKGIVHPDGTVRWLRISAAPIPLADYGVAIAYVDITSQKNTEAALHYSNVYYKSLTDVIPLCLYRKDQQGRLTFINPTCLHTLGKTAAEVLGKTVYDFYPPHLAAQYDAADQEVLQTGIILNMVEEHQAPVDARPTFVQVVKAPVRDENGTIIGTQGIYWDITDRLRLETALRESEAKLNTIFQSAIAAIYNFVVDAEQNWHYTYFSPGCEIIFGYPPETLIADSTLLLSRIPVEDREKLLNAVFPAIFAETTCQFEFSFQHQDGTMRWLKATVYSQKDTQQDCWHVTVAAMDISDRKGIELALRQSEAANQAILNAMPDLVIQMHRDGTYLQIYRSTGVHLLNPELLRVGCKLREALPQPMALERMTYIEQALTTGCLQVYEYEFCLDGETYYEEARIVPMDPDTVVLVVRDITDRKAAEMTLRQREQEFRTLVENSPDGILRIDPQFRFCYVNPVIAGKKQIAANQFLGKTPGALGFSEPTVQLWQDACIRAFDTRQEQELETQELFPTGLRVLSFRIVPEFDQDGAIPSLLIVSRDITELKQAQDELRHQTERERLIGTITQHIRQSLDLTQVLTTAVERMRQLLNADRALIYRFNSDRSGDMIAESVLPPWRSVIGTEVYDPCFTGALVEAYHQGKVHQIDDLQTFTGEACYAELLAGFQIRANLALPITDGVSLWGLFCIHHCAAPHVWQAWEVDLVQRLVDQLAIAIQQSELYNQVRQLNVTLEHQVQERTATLQRAFDFEVLLKRITDQVRDSLDEAQILETVVRELAEGLHLEFCDTGIYNADHTTVTVAYEFSKPSYPSIKGMTFEIASSPNLDIYPFLFRGQSVLFSNRVPYSLRPFPTPFTVLACPIWDGQTILGDLWLFRPATVLFCELEVRLAQQVANQCAIALRQSRLYRAAENQVVELERLNQLKDNFLSTVSHELRTPMSNIKMATELLEIYLTQLNILPADDSADDPTTNSPVARYFQILKNEGKREISLINDLLDLARLDAQSDPLFLSAIDLQYWLPCQLETFATRAEQQQQILTIDLPKTLPLLTTDPAYLQRILHELLNNACKYTPPGETICVSVRPIAADHRMAIRVANSGVDISAVECDRIFDRFYRIPNSDPWKHGGTGLGLALVKKLVERMQGTIRAESHGNQLQFIISLPLGK